MDKQEGNQFFFYHFVDQSTTFHTAVSTLCHLSQDAIRAIVQGWIGGAEEPS